MKIVTTGKVAVPALLENLEDLFRARTGEISSEMIRHVDVVEALVEPGAMLISVPKRLIAQLGLRQLREQLVRTLGGVLRTRIFSPVQLTVQGREFTCDIAEIPDDCPVLIGQIPLEGLDFVVDPIGQRLIGNPEHNGEHMIDIF